MRPIEGESLAHPGSQSAGPAGRSLIDDCVHCGFCLPACPTYVSWSEEMDSPRGRIDLMQGLAQGKLALTPTVVAHFDRCLGCMACMTACPSGVRYDVLIEETRSRIESDYRRGVFARAYRNALFAVLPYPKRLAAAALLMRAFSATGLRAASRRPAVRRLLPRRLADLEALAPSSPPASATLAPATPAAGERRARVGLVAGCVQRVFFPEVNAATLRVLSAEGCEVLVPADQGCCGALSVHAGRREEARLFARSLIASFEAEAGPLDAIVVNAAGCGSNLKDFGRLLGDDAAWSERAAAFAAKVRDVNEFLAGLAPVAARHSFPARVAYHDACHLAHAQRVRAEPRALLRAIPDLELVEVPDGGECCGSAGIYNLIQPESAAEIGERKADNVLATGADLLASANPGCSLQIQKTLRARGRALPAAHPIEILDASISGRPLPGRVRFGSAGH